MHSPQEPPSHLSCFSRAALALVQVFRLAFAAASCLGQEAACGGSRRGRGGGG